MAAPVRPSRSSQYIPTFFTSEPQVTMMVMMLAMMVILVMMVEVEVMVNMEMIMLSLIASRVYQQPNSWSPALMARVVAAMMVVVMVAMFMLQNNINYQQRES